MKAILKKILLIGIVCMLVFGMLTGCSSKGKTLMELDGVEMSENMLMLLMSRMKGTLSSSYMFGSTALNDSFWDTVMSAGEGTTYDTYYTDAAIDNAKTYLAALKVFDELGLKLPTSTLDSIDEELQALIDSDANGSKTAFNSMLSEYGVNYKMLREAYVMEAKIAFLSDHLFGSDGSLISNDNYEKYYQENYARFKQIFFYTSKPVYVVDEKGDVIYYSDLQNKIIAYDSSREGAVKKTDSSGAVVKDSSGQIIWVYTVDGVEHISYDKKGTDEQPTYPDPKLDDDGNIITDRLTTEEHIALADKAQIIVEDEAKEGFYNLFDDLVDKYGEDEGMEKYPNGYYMTRTSQYDAPEVVEALFEMEEGEIRIIEPKDGYGIHIVMKYELDEGGYSNSENADFFRNENGSYAFLATLKNQLLEDYLESYKANIVIDEDRRRGLSMKNVGANYNY